MPPSGTAQVLAMAMHAGYDVVAGLTYGKLLEDGGRREESGGRRAERRMTEGGTPVSAHPPSFRPPPVAVTAGNASHPLHPSGAITMRTPGRSPTGTLSTTVR